MKQFIFDSARESRIGDEIDVKGFKLSSDCDGKPYLFEITFIVENINYNNRQKDIVFRYGFEVARTHVHSEWFLAGLLPRNPGFLSGRRMKLRSGKSLKRESRYIRPLVKSGKLPCFLSLIASINGICFILTILIGHCHETDQAMLSKRMDKKYHKNDLGMYAFFEILCQKTDGKKGQLFALRNAEKLKESITDVSLPYNHNPSTSVDLLVAELNTYLKG